MTLEKLSDDNVEMISTVSVYLICYFDNYIQELYAKFPQLPFLSGVFDCDRKKHGEKMVNGHIFQVNGYKEIKDIPNKSALI